MRTWAWAAIILGGCFELETVRRPTLDCFDALGVRRPTFDDGRSESRPTTPRWCGVSPDHVPARPAPFAPGACLELRDGREWRRYGYDAAGRLVWVRDARSEARWYYVGDTLSGYKDFDGTLYRNDDHGRLIRIEGKLKWVEFQRDDAGRIVGRLSLQGVAGEQTECVARYDPETGALIEERCVDDATGEVDTRAVRWDPERDAWEERTVRDGAEKTVVWRCDADGRTVSDLEASFDPAGRLVRSRDPGGRCGSAGGQRLAYDAEGALIAHVDGCDAGPWGVASTVFVNSRPLCQTYDNDRLWWGYWPPFQREPLGGCYGNCEPYSDVIQPHGEVSMALPEWSRGRLSRLHLDVNADGHIDEVIDLPAEYDAEGRLIREAILGRFDVEQVEYRYDCE